MNQDDKDRLNGCAHSLASLAWTIEHGDADWPMTVDVVTDVAKDVLMIIDSDKTFDDLLAEAKNEFEEDD